MKRCALHPVLCVGLMATLAMGQSLARAQQGQQPPPFTAPQTPTPPASQAPGQATPPMQPNLQAPPDAPLPNPSNSTVPLRDLPPMSTQPASPEAPSPAILRGENTSARPADEAGPAPRHLFFRLDAYRAPGLPELPVGRLDRLNSLIRDGKLYLSLHDALALAIENNLDVEVSRYNLLVSDTEFKRASGGGTLRGIDSTITSPPPGIGESSSPLLAVQANTSNPLSTNSAVTDLSNVTQTGGTTAQSLSVDAQTTYSSGPPIPLFDPTLIAQAGYLRRSDTTQLINTTGSNGGTGSQVNTAPLDFTNAALDYQEGFSPGTQIDVYADNSPQVLYASQSQYDPFHAPSTSVTITQPLLRGFGRGVNLRFLRIARIEQKQSRLVFDQQLLETVYGISRLYYDLVALGENIGVKELSLATAEKLYQDDKSQVDQGTLAPIELTRAQALVSSSRLDLVQARGEYRQQEAVLRQQLLRRMDIPTVDFLAIVPTDTITVPDKVPDLDVPALIADALANRPDLVEASLQIKADTIQASAARNAVKPALNVYANVQTRGSSLVPYTTLGSPGTGAIMPNQDMTQGGLRLSTIYQGGVQLTLPLRNRIAQADAARDAINLRQAQGRSLVLENTIRQEVENAVIALQNAHQAYAAAVESRNYQQQLLQAELDKFTVGETTNFMIVQDESYLAQARSTEVAARANWMKAQIALNRALGNLLEKNNIILDDAIQGHLVQ